MLPHLIREIDPRPHLHDVGIFPDDIFRRVDDVRHPATDLSQKISHFAQTDDWTSRLDAWLFKMRTSMQVTDRTRLGEKLG
jgi:hypothetical protein